MRASIVFLLGMLALTSACNRTQTALVIRQQTTATGPRPASYESTQYWTSTAMMVDEPAYRIIVDFSAETITSLDKASRTYATVSFDATRAKMDANRERVERDTAGLAPDVIDALEKVGEPLGNRAAQVEVSLTGQHKNILGHDAEEYTLKATAVNGSIWVSPEVSLPLGETERQAYRKSMDGMPVPNMQFALAMFQLNAIPLRATLDYTFGKGGTKTEVEVLEIRREEVARELFEIPDEYGPQGAMAPLPPPVAPVPAPVSSIRKSSPSWSEYG